MRIEFLVEEPSMKACLEGFLPKLLPDADWEVFDYHSKENLLKKLPERLRGYASMYGGGGYDDLRVVVLVDRDEYDCRVLKAELEQLALGAGLPTLTAVRPPRRPGAPVAAPAGEFRVVNRVVCEELEAWYFGDPAACEQAYHRLRRGHFKAAQLQAPDAIAGGTWEAFGRVLHSAKHLPSAKPPSNRWKFEAAAAIGPHLEPDRNQSPSFQAFIAGVRAF